MKSRKTVEQVVKSRFPFGTEAACRLLDLAEPANYNLKMTSRCC